MEAYPVCVPTIHRKKWRCGPITLQAVIVCALCSATEKVYAAVIYSNLGPNDSFIVSPGTYPVWEQSNGAFIHRAASFTVPGTQNVVFGSADLGFYQQSGPNLARVELTANGSGNVPGNVIETINFTLPPPSSNPVIATATSNSNPILTAGSTYWIVASMVFAPSLSTWGGNNTNASGGNATRTPFMNGQWFLQLPSGMPSLRINALMIPEPTSLLLSALGIGALGTWRSRNARLQR